MARWYIIHAYSGFENKVRDQILAEAERIGLSQLVEAVEVPTEQVTEVRRGKKIKAEMQAGERLVFSWTASGIATTSASCSAARRGFSYRSGSAELRCSYSPRAGTPGDFPAGE